MKEAEQCLAKLNEEFKELEQEENKLKSEEVDMKNEMEKYDTLVKENQAKVKHWQKEVWDCTRI